MHESDIEKIALSLKKAEQLLIQMCQVHSALLGLVMRLNDRNPPKVHSLMSETKGRHKQIRSRRAEPAARPNGASWDGPCGGDYRALQASGRSAPR